MLPKVRIDPEFESLVPPLSSEEFSRLEESILTDGCRDALIAWRGLLLDGHHRKRICEKHGLKYRVCTVDLPDRDGAYLWIIRNQCGRRNITPEQLSYLRGLEYRLHAKQGRRTDLTCGNSCHKTVRAAETLALAHNVSPRTIRHDAAFADAVEFVISVAGGDAKGILLSPERNLNRRDVIRLAEAAEHEKNTARKALKLIAKKSVRTVEEALRIARDAAGAVCDSGGDILTGDMALLWKRLADNSVDLFLTDPPYSASALDSYSELSRLAQEKLKPGGYCIAYSGQINLPQAISRLSRHLDYYWTGALIHGGGTQQIHPRHILCGWKPIIIMRKRPAGKPSDKWIRDVIPGGGRDKRFTRLGQDASELTYWIECLTPRGGLVVDPFCGGGAVPVACRATGRRWLATELDPVMARRARKRLTEST